MSKLFGRHDTLILYSATRVRALPADVIGRAFCALLRRERLATMR